MKTFALIGIGCAALVAMLGARGADAVALPSPGGDLKDHDSDAGDYPASDHGGDQEGSSEGIELPGITEIGSGYDANGYYAHSLSLKLSPFDLYKKGKKKVTLDPLHQDTSTFFYPAAVTFHRVNDASYEFSSGRNSKDLSTDLTKKAGLEVSGQEGLFSASLSTEFVDNTLESSAYTYTRVQYNINQYTLQLGGVDELRDLLTESARREINEKPPAELDDLFDNYGPVYLTSLVMGGRAVVSASTSKFSYTSTHNVDVVAKLAAAFLIGSTTASGESDLKQQATDFRESSKISVTIRGGDTEFADQLPAEFGKWAKSVQAQPQFVDFLDNRRSLRGIWTLANSTAREGVLKAAALKYMAARAKNFIQNDMGAVLEGMWLPLVETGSSSGSGASSDMYAFKPQIGDKDADLFYLGQTGSSYASTRADRKGLAVREIVRGVLGEIGGWDRIWDDAGSRRADHLALWHPVPQSTENYVALGSFFRGCGAANLDAPPAAESARLRVLHKQFVEPAVRSGERFVWDDSGIWGSAKQCSVWQFDVWGSFVGSPSRSAVPWDRAFTIKQSAINFTDGSSSRSGWINKRSVPPLAAAGRRGKKRPLYSRVRTARGGTRAAFVTYRVDSTA